MAMIDHRNRKKKLIISYKNLSDEVRELFKECYPDGYADYLQKTIKPNGEPIFVVPLETEDTSYMVKFDVKIDSGLVDEDLDKDLYGTDDDGNDGEFAPLSEAIDKEEGNHSVGKLQHGAYEELGDDLAEEKKVFEMATKDIESEFGSISDDLDDEEDDLDDEDDDMEPDDEDLLDIEALLEEADSGEGLIREDNPPEEKRRGRKRKTESPEIKAIKAVRAEVKEAKKTSKKLGRPPKNQSSAPKKLGRPPKKKDSE